MKKVNLSDAEWKIMNLLWGQAPRTMMQITNTLKAVLPRSGAGGSGLAGDGGFSGQGFSGENGHDVKYDGAAAGAVERGHGGTA